MSIEAVYDRAINADFWLNIGSCLSLEDVPWVDARFVDIRAWRNGMVFNNNKRVNEFGGNDYWESGMIRQDEILADLIAILHPDLLPGRQLVYYRKLSDQ